MNLRYEKEARACFRFEGRLMEKYEVPLDQYNAIVSRIKILAELDISERRLPQDGFNVDAMFTFSFRAMLTTSSLLVVASSQQTLRVYQNVH